VAEITGTSLYRVNDLKSARKPRPPAWHGAVRPGDSGALSAVRRGLAAGAAVSESSRCCEILATCRECLHAALPCRAGARTRAQLSAPPAVRIFDERPFAASRWLLPGRHTRQRSHPASSCSSIAARGAIARRWCSWQASLRYRRNIAEDPEHGRNEVRHVRCATVLAPSTLPRAASSSSMCRPHPHVREHAFRPCHQAGDIVTSARARRRDPQHGCGRPLILCDALNYARRFDPEVVSTSRL